MSGFDDSESIVFLIIIVTLVIGPDHVDQAVVGLHRVFDVEIVSHLVLLSQNCDDEILEHGPAVLHIEIDLSGKGLWVPLSEANNLVCLGRVDIVTLHESEAHHLDTTDDRHERPSVEVRGVVGDFFVEHRASHLIQVFGPALSLLVPLKHHEHVRQVISGLVPEVDAAPDADSDIISQLEQFILVTKSEHLLVLSFLMRVISVEFKHILRVLTRHQQVSVHLGSFFHQLADTVNRVIIDWSVGWLGSLTHSLHVEHVLRILLISLVNEEHVLELLDLHVPRVDSSG